VAVSEILSNSVRSFLSCFQCPKHQLHKIWILHLLNALQLHVPVNLAFSFHYAVGIIQGCAIHNSKIDMLIEWGKYKNQVFAAAPKSITNIVFIICDYSSRKYA